jgi:hypothetical protein
MCLFETAKRQIALAWFRLVDSYRRKNKKEMHASNVHIFFRYFFHNNNLTSIMLYFLTRFSLNKEKKLF